MKKQQKDILINFYKHFKYKSIPFTIKSASELLNVSEYNFVEVLNILIENRCIGKTNDQFVLIENKVEKLYDLLNINLKSEKEIEFTNGNEYVYVYYYPSYKELAYFNDVNRWPCKVGMTTREFPLLRINEQLNESTPEKPQIALLIRCNHAKYLERLLHNYLKAYDNSFTHFFNNEWFNTNPSEIEQIISNLKENVNY